MNSNSIKCMWIIWLSVAGGLFFVAAIVMVFLYMGAGVCDDEAKVVQTEEVYLPED